MVHCRWILVLLQNYKKIRNYPHVSHVIMLMAVKIDFSGATKERIQEMDIKNFDRLSALIGRENFATDKKNTKVNNAVRFMLIPTNEGVKLVTVGSDLSPVDVTSADVQKSPAAAVVAAIRGIFESRIADFAWDGAEPKPTDGLILGENESLVPLLADCVGLLVDQEGRTLEFDTDSQFQVKYFAKRKSEGSDADWYGAFTLDDGSQVKGFISPDLVLTDHSVSRIANVGAGFAYAGLFLSDFKDFDLESTLSILLSAMSNVALEVEGMKVRIGKNEVMENPLIIFERVDVDDSLFMRISRKSANLPSSLCDRFRFTRVAVREDNEIVIRTVKEAVEEPEALIGGILRKIAGRGKSSEIWEENGLFVVPRDVASTFLFSHLSVCSTISGLWGQRNSANTRSQLRRRR